MLHVADDFSLSGEVHVNVWDGDLPEMSGTELSQFLDRRWPELWKQRWLWGDVFPNIVTNVGRQRATQLIVAESTAYFGFIAVSTATIVPALTDTSLPTEFFRKLAAVRQSYNTFYSRWSVYYAAADWASTSIKATGLFDTASTGGTMGSDAVITLSKTAVQAATLEWRWLASS